MAMTSTAVRHISKRVVAFSLGLAFLVGGFSFGISAQEILPALQAVSSNSQRQSTVHLASQLQKLQLCLSNDADLDHLRLGLLYGYTQGKGLSRPIGPVATVPPPPGDYMASLQHDIDACEYASHATDPAVRREVLDLVRQDIKFKSIDCQMFGMGRMVPVRIVTIQGGAPVNGWTAYYKWSSVSSLPVAEMSAAGLTSNAAANLVPGVYTFRAELKTSATETRKTISVTLPVGGQNTVEVQLPVQ
jgi:hypothetical protein